jgi:TatD DNase family protein
LYVEAFDEDRQQVLEDAMAAGVSHFFIPAIDSNYIERMYALEKQNPERIHLMAGLHPTHVKEDFLDELDQVDRQLKQRAFCAVGEIGMDLYWDKTFIEEQKEAFTKQIQWAKDFQLPIVIHCRDAFDEVFEVLEIHKGDDLSGIFHCFTGTKEQAQRAIGLNLKLGIGGVVTFKKGKIDQFLDQISIDHIVLETDAPYLAPAPFRGKRNQSEYLIYILRKLSEIHQRSEEEIAALTTQNALAVFKM